MRGPFISWPLEARSSWVGSGFLGSHYAFFLAQLLNPPEMGELANVTLSLGFSELILQMLLAFFFFFFKFQEYMKVVGGTQAVNGWPACLLCELS